MTLGILLSVLLSLRIYYLRPVIEITGSKACLPEHLHHKTHTDWEFKKQTPWHTNVICDHGPPLQVWGNQDYWSVAENKRIGPKPIPRPGEWQLSRKTFPTHKGPRDLYYFAFTVHIFGEWYHFRVAEFRWDDVDGYYIFFSAASKFLPIAWERLLWHRQNG
ncbi:MAG: hypothetical protein JNN11_00015 [Candidatus Doudnabacteria bacterium]|nr:hypothetical protein [Candidatus Doudnabacteria bacterium]